MVSTTIVLLIGSATLVSCTKTRSGGVPPPPTVRPTAVPVRVTHPALPMPGQSVLARYVARIRCPVRLDCPSALIRVWTTNIQGVDINYGLLSLLVKGSIGKRTMFAPAGPGSAPDQAGGSVVIGQWLRARGDRSWVYTAYQQASQVAKLAGQRLDWFLREETAGGSRPKAVTFRGEPALASQDFSFWGDRDVSVYVTRKSHLLDGFAMTACVQEEQSPAESPCVRWNTSHSWFLSGARMGTCAAPRRVYAYYFDGSRTKRVQGQTLVLPRC
jgi:hypothetical protein